jgi:hypothetical protein
MRYEFKCSRCAEIFELEQPMNFEHTALHCGVEANRIWGDFQTDRDLAYQFTTNIFGHPTVIYSRRQYKNLLKKHGLSAKATPLECLQMRKQKKNTTANYKYPAINIATKLGNEGILKYVPGAIKAAQMKEKYGENKTGRHK